MAKKCILFVDDESNMLSGLRRVLKGQRSKWDMVFANSGREALDVFEGRDVDVIVSDMKMPGMDGAELLDRIANEYPETIRLMFSGMSEKSQALQVVSSAHQFLSKGDETGKLIETIQKAIDLVAEIDNPELRRSISNAKGVVTPNAFTDLSNLRVDDQNSIFQMCDVVGDDVGMTAKVMQLVSSSFFGTGSLSDGVEQVCEQLDGQLMRELFEQTDAFSAVQEHDATRASLLKKINSHSVLVASLARKIAAIEHHETSTRAHLAGMMHDIGKAVMLQTWPDAYIEFENIQTDEQDRGELEKQVFGTTHPEVGAYLLRLWGIHEEIIQVTRYHHTPEESGVQNFGPLASVFIANTFLNLQDDEDQLIEQLESSAFLKRIGYADHVMQWVDQLHEFAV